MLVERMRKIRKEVDKSWRCLPESQEERSAIRRLCVMKPQNSWSHIYVANRRQDRVSYIVRQPKDCSLYAWADGNFNAGHGHDLWPVMAGIELCFESGCLHLAVENEEHKHEGTFDLAAIMTYNVCGLVACSSVSFELTETFLNITSNKMSQIDWKWGIDEIKKERQENRWSMH